MRHYETIYIVDPNLGDEEYRELTGKFNSLIENQKGVVIKTKEWGKQRLAYVVKKFNYGFYVLIDFCADPGVTSELERSLKLDDRILKYQTVKISDRADPEELLLKEREAKKEVAVPEGQETREEPAVQDEDSIKESEVQNGEG
jgi:small subunit ribosomal protein S6